MKREVLTSLWGAHRVAGSLLGALIFLIFVTGTLCTFRDELRLWSSPVARSSPAQDVTLAPSGQVVQQVIARFEEHHPLRELPRWALLLPIYPQGSYELIYQDKSRPTLVRAFVGGPELSYLGESNNNPGEFVFLLHANLTLRGKTGRILVGLFGLGCLFLVITGILIHRQKLRNAFALRRGKSLRRTLGDTHRAMGLWGVGFFAVISFTGAVLGLKPVLMVAPTAVQFKGDLKQAKKALRPASVKRSGREAPMKDVELLWTRMHQELRQGAGESDFVPTILNAWAWGDANAQLVLSGSLPGQLAAQNEAATVRVDAVSGKLLNREWVGQKHWPARLYSSMAPLHYGDFGGWPLKFLYAALGGCGVLLVGSGLMIWAQRGGEGASKETL